RPAAVGLADGLVPEADAEDRDARAQLAHHVERDPGLVGRARARRDHDPPRRERGDVGHRERVVALHPHLGAERLQVLHEVPGETVVVVDYQQHARYNPFAAVATARNSARPLFMVSSHSFAGSESCTMPAPACTCSLPSWITAVRIAIAVSASPCQPM